MITIYHNPRCAKSRECLVFLEQSNLKYELVKYLEVKFTFQMLSNLLVKLKYKPIELVRTKEKIWIENFKGKELSDNDIITAMVENPTLIERPIVVKNEIAIVARPVEKVKIIL